MDNILQLFPIPSSERPLEGTYLSHNLRQYGNPARPFVYTNFVTSLDGRIAVPHATRPGMTVPGSIANERDWRLFQELNVQADLVISSGRYLRDLADGRGQEMLRVDDPRFTDLIEWRTSQGLLPLPDLAIISRTLDFPIPSYLTEGGRKVVVFTSAEPDPSRVRELEDQAGSVFVVGDEQVDGVRMAAKMGELGYKTVYNASGGKVLHMLISAEVLDRIYLTRAHRILGGKPYSSIVEGELFEMPPSFKLDSLYLDQSALDGAGQTFGCWDRISEKN